MPLDDMSWKTTETEVDETTALLIRARSFVERGWCRGKYAQDEFGNYVFPTDLRAVAWCAFGAMVAAGLRADTSVLHHPAFRRFRAVVGVREADVREADVREADGLIRLIVQIGGFNDQQGDGRAGPGGVRPGHRCRRS